MEGGMEETGQDSSNMMEGGQGFGMVGSDEFDGDMEGFATQQQQAF